MNPLLPTGQISILEAAADALWSGFQKPLTIVKKAFLSGIIESSGYVPGYGTPSNESNYTYAPESGTFNCLRVLPKPDGTMDYVTLKVLSQEEIIVKVLQDARDYIMDGREIENVIYAGKKYNVDSQETTSYFLGKTYYYFRLTLVT